MLVVIEAHEQQSILQIVGPYFGWTLYSMCRVYCGSCKSPYALGFPKPGSLKACFFPKVQALEAQGVLAEPLIKQPKESPISHTDR